MEFSFGLFGVQNEFGFSNENVLRVKRGYCKKSRLANCAKMRILKMGVPLFKLASCMYYMVNILSISLLSRVHDTSCYFEMQKDLSQHFTF